ncbi:hypothetical protein ACFQ07_13575, partial [Actinomadura adrarensis]
MNDPSITRPLWRVRLAFCYLTLAACLPYLTLKALWLSGADIGLDAEAADQMHSAKFMVANAVTMGMELTAVLVAFTFTYPFGRRLPAWLVLFPMWVGTGLLAPIALGAPLGMLVQAVAGGSPLPG